MTPTRHPSTTSTDRELPALDLFAGAGGLSIGLSEARFRVELAVELDPLACLAYATHHPARNVVCGDIRHMSFRHLRGSIALVAGGPPCQPFSSGGKRLAEQDPRDCLPEFLRVLDEVQPDACLIENVVGLTTGRRRAYFEELLAQLRQLGFAAAWQLLNAADYGVPQKRRRLFVVGMRGQEFVFPTPTHGEGADRPWRRSGSVLRRDREFGESNPSIVTYAKNPDLRPSPYDGHLFNGGGRPIDLSAPAPTILAAAGGNKTPFVDTLGLVPAYHAHLLAGGKPRSGAVKGARRITVAEAAALQTFPPGVEFAGPRSTQYTLVGNALPPQLAESIGARLAQQMRGEAILREAA